MHSAIGAKQKKKKEKDDFKIEDTTPPDTDTGEEKDPIKPAAPGPSLLTGKTVILCTVNSVLDSCKRGLRSKIQQSWLADPTK